MKRSLPGGFDRDRKGTRDALGLRYCSINIWDGSELKLAWSMENNSYFENNLPMNLLSGNSNTSVFKVCNVLRWVHFLKIKSVSLYVGFRQEMFEYNLYSIYIILLLTNFIYIKSFFITVIIQWCFRWYVSFEFSSKPEFTSNLEQTLKDNHGTSHNCHSV